MNDVNVRRITSIGGGKHTKLILQKDGICMTAMYFGVGEGELGVEEGDDVDVLFNIDVNDYKNVRSAQMILHDIRLCQAYAGKLDEEKRRYEQIKAGDAYLIEECVIPTRDDFARVYTALRREYRAGNNILDTKGILKLVNTSAQERIGYVKLKYVLRILNELSICVVEELGSDIYRFEIFFNANKTNIEKSSILKKLKSQCANRQCAD